MINICWIQHSSERLFVGQLADRLKDKGMRIQVVCKFLDDHEKYQIDGFKSSFISDVFNYERELTQTELIELDRKYGPPGIQNIYQSDVQLWYYFKDNMKEIEQVIGWAYKFWEDYLNKNKIDYFLVRETGGFATRTAYNVARKRDIPLAQILPGVKPDLFYLADIEEDHVSSELIQEINKPDKKLSPEQRQLVDKYISDRIVRPDTPIRPRQLASSVYQVFRSIISLKVRDTKANRDKDPIRIAAYRYGIKRTFKRAIWKYFTNRLFGFEKSSDEKYVYFPFYSGFEPGYLSNDHYWAINQLSLIKEVAESLPVGFKLYVKEHPGNPGFIPYHKLKKLRKIHNIKILDTTLHSQKIIDKCQAVVVLEGTVGWEAFLVKKPVVSVGNPFYLYSPIVYDARDITKITKAIWSALRKGSKIYEEHEEEWAYFIYSVISTCGKGDTARRVPGVGLISQHKDIKEISAHIAKKIKKDLKINDNL